MAEKWVSVSDACQMLEVSERTLYRKIKDGKIESRMTDDGRREVMLSVPMSQEELAEGHLKLASETVDNQLKIVATALGSTEMVSKRMQAELDFVKTELDRVREQSREEIDRLQEQSKVQVDFVRGEMSRARKFGMVGWAIATGIFLVLTIVAIVSVKSLSDRKGEIATIKQQVEDEKRHAGLLTDVLTDKDRQISRLEGEVTHVRSELTDTKMSFVKFRTAISSQPASQPVFRQVADISAVMTDSFVKPVTTSPATLPASRPTTAMATTQAAH
jgi:excisionase family DNA binding protein